MQTILLTSFFFRLSQKTKDSLLHEAGRIGVEVCCGRDGRSGKELGKSKLEYVAGVVGVARGAEQSLVANGVDEGLLQREITGLLLKARRSCRVHVHSH